MARLVEEIARRGATAIGLDVLMPEPVRLDQPRFADLYGELSPAATCDFLFSVTCPPGHRLETTRRRLYQAPDRSQSGWCPVSEGPGGEGRRCRTLTPPLRTPAAARRACGGRSPPPEAPPAMSKVRVDCFAISLDGFGAGPRQDLENPLGVGGLQLHGWVFPTRTFRAMHVGAQDGTTGVDDDFARRGMEHLGAWILGRNMFGPIRGAWPDEQWKGWWGASPPYHVPVFVLTHHPRKPLEMEGGTTFHFVTGGIEEALARAREAAGAKDIRVGGGVETIRQYLRARLVDELHLAITPVLLGSGEPLLAGLDLPSLGYRVARHVPSDAALHVLLTRGAAG